MFLRIRFKASKLFIYNRQIEFHQIEHYFISLFPFCHFITVYTLNTVFYCCLEPLTASQERKRQNGDIFGDKGQMSNKWNMFNWILAAFLNLFDLGWGDAAILFETRGAF